ncbi:MAG: hypothetical protein JW822_03880 [Spirochaetales bacterium]|nr:hypothetical protein [Spirochaetales bacterium]
MRIRNADKLVSLSLPNMSSIGSLSISYNDLLTTISLPQLTKAGSLRIMDNAQLLTVITGYITVMDNTLSIEVINKNQLKISCQTL